MFVALNLFCIRANLRIKCVNEPKNVSVSFYKNLESSFSTWLTHLTLRFLYFLGCSGPRCGGSGGRRHQGFATSLLTHPRQPDIARLLPMFKGKLTFSFFADIKVVFVLLEAFCQLSSIVLEPKVCIKYRKHWNSLGRPGTGTSRLMRISLLRFFKTITTIWLMRFYGLFILLVRT